MEYKNIVAIIGDIHGCFYTLSALYEKIQNYTSEIYSVGDLIDRGNFSKEVIEFCIDNNIKPVLGNHEIMLLDVLERPNVNRIELHFRNGGKKTAKSYFDIKDGSNINEYYEAVNGENHLKFLKTLPYFIELENIMISHAGFHSYEDKEKIIWSREKPVKLNKLQIFGHTPVKSPEHKKKYYINLDTGAVYNNKLSAVIIDLDTQKVIEFISEDTKYIDIA
ncbi:MAG TPA: metallophosphoesterase [Ignavibacteria bacterium]|nr:metallophosphoesterase [Ignavibacteria bacterium]